MATEHEVRVWMHGGHSHTCYVRSYACLCCDRPREKEKMGYFEEFPEKNPSWLQVEQGKAAFLRKKKKSKLEAKTKLRARSFQPLSVPLIFSLNYLYLEFFWNAITQYTEENSHLRSTATQHMEREENKNEPWSTLDATLTRQNIRIRLASK